MGRLTNDLRDLTSLTLSMWVNPQERDYNKRRVLAYLSATDAGTYHPSYGIASVNANTHNHRFSLLFDNAPGVGTAKHAGGLVDLPTDIWHLVTATFDADEMLMCFYVDGELQDSTDTSPHSAIFYADYPWIVGNNWFIIAAGRTHWGEAYYDEIAIYSTAKSADWVAGVYTAAADNLLSLSALSLEHATLGMARKAVEQTAGSTLAVHDSLLALSALTIEHATLGMARKAVEQTAGSTLAVHDSLLSLSALTIESIPLGIVRPMGSDRSGA
jgi:hypothetical protein